MFSRLAMVFGLVAFFIAGCWIGCASSADQAPALAGLSGAAPANPRWDRKKTIEYWNAVFDATTPNGGMETFLAAWKEVEALGAEVRVSFCVNCAALSNADAARIASLPLQGVDPVATELADSLVQRQIDEAQFLQSLAQYIYRVENDLSVPQFLLTALGGYLASSSSGEAAVMQGLAAGAAGTANSISDLAREGQSVGDVFAALQMKSTTWPAQVMDARVKLTTRYTEEFKVPAATSRKPAVPSASDLDPALVASRLIGRASDDPSLDLSDESEFRVKQVIGWQPTDSPVAVDLDILLESHVLFSTYRPVRVIARYVRLGSDWYVGKVRVVAR